MNYYEENSQAFIDNTLNIDMSEFYSIFLKKLKYGSSILDIGCGAGRDLKYFKNQGHFPIGVEPSQKLASYARQYAGCEVFEKSIEVFETSQKFDAVWACASLLHLGTDDLKLSLEKIGTLMHDSSIFYCSFKYGEFKGERNGRFFNDQTLESLNALLPNDLVITKSWVSEDKRPQRDEKWLNVLIRKKIT